MPDNWAEMIPVMDEVKEVFDRCQRRFVTIQLPFEDYLLHLEGKLAHLTGVPADPAGWSDPWVSTFRELHHEDLFLALACARGDRIAWEYFADDYLPLLERLAAQSCHILNESMDLAQEIVSRLLERGERLAGYNGRASLAGWLRVSVSHAAIDRFRRSRKQISLEEIEESPQSNCTCALTRHESTPEEGVDARWGPVLSKVLVEEIRRLPARDRLLLSLYYLQNVPLKLIGRQFGVHEATASRWLENLRQGIRKRIEKELRTRHGLRRREIQSLWHLVSEREGFSVQEALQK